MKRLLLLLALWPSLLSAGQTYYVRKGGSDGASGTSWANAWLTSVKVQSTIAAGDTIIWGRGIWEEVRINPPPGGSNTNWIVYACSTWKEGTTGAEKVAGKNLTIWTGGKSVTGWSDTTVTGGAVWSKSSYNPSVNCKTDGSESGRCYAARVRDSMYIPIAAKATMATAGRGHFYNGGDAGGNMVYVYRYGSGTFASADTVWVSCEAPLAFDSNNTNHVRVWGIQIELGHNSAVAFRANNVDSVFIEHGHIRMGGTSEGNNGSAVYGEGQGRTSCSNNHVVACSLAWGVTVPSSVATAPDDGLRHGGVATIYSEHHFVFDSCYAYGYAARGLFFKLSKEEEDPWLGCTVKNCTIDGATLQGDVGLGRAGICFEYECGDDSAYGNVVFNCDYGITKLWDGGFLHADKTTFFNNTIYNCDDAAILLNYSTAGTAAPYEPGKIFYNVLVNSGAWSFGAISFRNGSSAVIQDTFYIDSNYIWRSGGSTTFQCHTGGAGITWSQWTTAGDGNCNNSRAFDVHGLNSDPGLNNPGAGDFSRPSASNEMNRSYGGQSWTIWGAVQETEAVVANLKIYQTTLGAGKFYCTDERDE